MKRHMIWSMLVTATVLVQFAGLAAAATQAYDVEIGDFEQYVMLGSNPVLEQDTGEAEISEVVSLGGGLIRVEVHCFDDSPADCTGDIVTS